MDSGATASLGQVPGVPQITLTCDMTIDGHVLHGEIAIPQAQWDDWYDEGVREQIRNDLRFQMAREIVKQLAPQIVEHRSGPAASQAFALGVRRHLRVLDEG